MGVDGRGAANFLQHGTPVGGQVGSLGHWQPILLGEHNLLPWASHLVANFEEELQDAGKLWRHFELHDNAKPPVQWKQTVGCHV